MFEIIYEDPDTQEKKFVFQNSWGMTTRTIGVLIMVHGDNQGLVLPPRVASIQVVIVPCGITASLPQSEKDALLNACNDVQKKMTDIGIRVHGDYRDNYSPGWKFNHWELKGVPIRMEIGPKDLKLRQVLTVRRDSGKKETFKIEEVDSKVKVLLDDIQNDMYQRVTEELNKHVVTCKQWNDFCQNLDNKNIILSPFCGEIPCEETIKKNSARAEAEDLNAPSMGAKSLCIPLVQPECGIVATDKCINPECSMKPKFYTLFGRSY
jgi:bifunctional glutamyl/prolyl-tRNA synthetase